jgi:uncharacterized protein
MWKEKLESRVKEILENSNAISGHDIYHMKRVWHLAKQIAAGENVPVDLDVVYAACLLHDAGHTIPDIKNDPTHEGHPKRSVQIAKQILPEVGFPQKKMPLTLQAILLHDDTKPWGSFTKTDKREIWYVQDADNLEAIGAMGLTRIIAYGAKVGMALYTPERPLDDPESKSKSIIHDIYAHLSVYFNTETAKIIAAPRICFAKQYIAEFLGEFTYDTNQQIFKPC